MNRPWIVGTPREYNPTISERAFGKGAEYGFKFGGEYDDRYNTYESTDLRDAFKRGFKVGKAHRK